MASGSIPNTALYVTDYGTDSATGAYYRKWSDGRKECWVEKPVSSTLSAGATNQVYIAFPTGLFTVSAMAVGSVMANGYQFVHPAYIQCNAAGADTYIKNFGSSNVANYRIRLYAYGT